MKIDSHVHFLISKKQQTIDIDSINNMLDIARMAEISAICITEHIEAESYHALMKAIFIDNILNAVRSELYMLTKQGVKLYPGAEIQLSNGSNIGVHAPYDSLMRLNPKAGHYTLPELDNELASYNDWYYLVAHHIFWPNKTYKNHKELTEYVCAIEVPAKDLDNSERYISLANDFDLPTVGGSDAHTFIQIGACYSDIKDREIGDEHPLSLISLVNEKNHVFSDFSKRQVRMSNIYRSTQGI